MLVVRLKEDNITPRPGSQAYTSYADVIRTKRYTSITKKGEGNNEEDASGGGANQLFRSRPNTVRIQTSTQMLHKTKMCFTILSSQHPLLKLGLTWTTSLRS